MAEGRDHEPRPEPCRFAAHEFDLRGGPFVGVERPGEILLDIRSEHLHGDQPPVRRHRPVDLCDRRGADRLRVDFAEQLLDRLFETLLDRRLDLRERGRRQAVLKPGQVASRLLADQIGAGRQGLTELDRCRSDLLKGLGISGDFRNGGAEAGDPSEPPNRRRRVHVALDSAKRAVPSEHTAPFQKPPDMDRRVGQIFQPLWMATRPPRIGSARTRRKPACSIRFAKAAMSGNRSIDSTR